MELQEHWFRRSASQPAGLPHLGKGRLLPQVGVLQGDVQLACPWLREKSACHSKYRKGAWKFKQEVACTLFVPTVQDSSSSGFFVGFVLVFFTELEHATACKV